MALAPEFPFDLAETMLDVIVDAYDVAGAALPERQYVAAGTPVDDCPILAVTLEALSPSELNPAVDVIDPISASLGFASQSGLYAIYLIRCTDAVPRVKGSRFIPPTVGQEQSAAEQVYDDSIRVHNALVAAQKSGNLAGCNSVIFQSWNVIGPSGGHVGGVTRVKVGMSRG